MYCEYKQKIFKSHDIFLNKKSFLTFQEYSTVINNVYKYITTNIQ